MDLDELIDIYLNPLLDKKESKSILLGYFNVNLLKFDHHASTSNSKTLIDNIFSSIFGPDPLSGNLPATVSDHLPQFVIPYIIFFTHIQIVSEIFMKKVRLTLTNKILFFTF